MHTIMTKHLNLHLYHGDDPYRNNYFIFFTEIKQLFPAKAIP